MYNKSRDPFQIKDHAGQRVFFCKPPTLHSATVKILMKAEFNVSH